MIKKICLIVWVWGLCVCSARADLYRVGGIPISAELESAKEARSAAIENGETDAFWALMKKMVAPEYQQQIPMPVEADIHRWVRTVSLANEKNTATKYMADLSVGFDEGKIQDFLTQNQIPYLTKDLPDMVIVPVMKKGSESGTLDEQNPLYSYLKGKVLGNDLWKAVLPVGDLEEITWVNEALNSGSEEALAALADRYEAAGVMIVKVSQQGPYVGADVSYVPAQPALDNHVDVMATNGKIGPVLPDLWRKIVDGQERKWRVLKTQNFESQMIFWAQVPVGSLKEWTVLYQKLKKADFLNGLAIRGFRPSEVWVSFGYKGTSLDLNRQLRPLGLALTVGEQSGVWVLRPWGRIDE